MGEDLGSLSLKDLQNLEQQLDSALTHIRSRKVQTSEIRLKANVTIIRSWLWLIAL